MRLGFIVDDLAIIRRWEVRGGFAEYNRIKDCWCYTRFRGLTRFIFRVDCYGARECRDLYLARTSRLNSAGQLEGQESYVQISLEECPTTGEELLIQLLENWGAPHDPAHREAIWCPELQQLTSFWDDFLASVEGYVEHGDLHTDTGELEW
jgi:hypothetical protein